jgi:hypothetical protein
VFSRTCDSAWPSREYQAASAASMAGSPRELPMNAASTAKRPAAAAIVGPVSTSATRPPAMAGPVAEFTENPTLSAALPARSAPCGSSSATLAERVTARPVAASAPLTNASSRTRGSQNAPVSTAMPPRSAASST